MALPLIYNFESVRVRWASTVVAVLGIAGSVGVFVAMLALARGFQAALVSSGSEHNAMVRRAGATSEMDSAITLEQLHAIEEPSKLVNARLKPAWSLAFRWPDGARVAVLAEQRPRPGGEVGDEHDARELGLRLVDVPACSHGDQLGPGEVPGEEAFRGRLLLELGAQPFFKTIAQGTDPRVLFVDCRPRQFGRFSKANDGGDIIGPGAPATLLRAPDEEWLETRLSIDVKRADTFRSMQFVPREGKKMNRQFLQIDRHLPNCLDRIGMKENAFAATKAGDFFERIDHAGFVVRPHH